MTFKPFATTAVAVAATLMAAQGAMAQPAAAPAITHGPPIAGACIISIEAAIGGSAVGKSVDTRMQQIIAQVNAELNGEKTAIDTEAKALDGQRATLAQAQFEQRATALQNRANALQQKAALREREISATEQKAIGRIGTEMDPLVRQAYQAKNCSVLLQRTAVVIANPAMDITQQVVTALDAKITTFTFERERLDAAPAAAAPRR